MTSPQYTVLFSAPVSGTGPSSGAVADVMIPDASTGLFVKATTANRGTRRSWGFALSSYSAGGAVDIQQIGTIDVTTAGLGAGTASWVRCSTTGTLERAAVSGTDDVVGWVETDGTFHACFGFLTAAIVNGGGGGFTPPTGTGLVTVTAGALNGAATELPLSAASVVQATGTGIPHVIAGVLSAASSLIVDADVTSVALGKLTGLAAGIATFLATPSGANLGAALTSALTVAKGGTGATASTGSGNVVLATSPTLATATNTGLLTTGGVAITGTTANNGTGTLNDVTIGTNPKIRFTNASGPTVTGFNASGVVDGQKLLIIVDIAAGTIAIPSESASSLAANRVHTNAGITINVPAGCYCELMYDAVNSRWLEPTGGAI